jgi:hypothetical protein
VPTWQPHRLLAAHHAMIYPPAELGLSLRGPISRSITAGPPAPGSCIPSPTALIDIFSLSTHIKQFRWRKKTQAKTEVRRSHSTSNFTCSRTFMRQGTRANMRCCWLATISRRSRRNLECILAFHSFGQVAGRSKKQRKNKKQNPCGVGSRGCR